MDSKKEKTMDGWWINFLYCCAMSIGRPRPLAPLLPDLLLASPSPGGALLPEHPGRSQPPLQAVQRHHPRPFIASSTLDPTPHPRSFSYRVSSCPTWAFSTTWAPWDDHIINFKITTWSMYFTASPCSTTCEVQKLLLVRVHLNPGQFISSKHIYFCSALIFLLNCLLNTDAWCSLVHVFSTSLEGQEVLLLAKHTLCTKEGKNIHPEIHDVLDVF